MLYAWATTYPMFRDIPDAEFGAAHKTYERGLPLGVYAPFGAMALAVLIAVIVRPAEVPTGALWMASVALAGGLGTTLFCAAPMHVALIKHGKDPARIERMLACNTARAGFALVGMAASIWTLAML
jgi:hypothetical protein